MRGLPRPEVTSAKGLRVVSSCGLASIFLALVFVLFGFLSRFFFQRAFSLVCSCAIVSGLRRAVLNVRVVYYCTITTLIV